jgi:hypothetical protein
MGEERKKTARLLLTFDLSRQEMVGTEEVTGHFDGKLQPVSVDWSRLLTTIRGKKPPDPPDPPWTRAVVDDDYQSRGTPPWSASDDVESNEGEERPPEV